MKRILFLLLFAASLTAQPVFDENYERILLPVYTPPVQGAFGSEFHTRLTLWNKSRTETLQVYGVEPHCILTCPTITWIEMKPFGSDEESMRAPELMPNGRPGRFVFIRKEQANMIAMNLRAFDLSRDDVNYGTAMPVVRERDFSDDRIVLPGVPMYDQRFRKTLRIYSKEAATVEISFEGPYIIGSPVILPPRSQTVTLTPGLNQYDPAYAVFTNFALYPEDVSVVVEPLPPCAICPLPHVRPAVWAFITVTNNATQHITTITPEP